MFPYATVRARPCSLKTVLLVCALLASAISAHAADASSRIFDIPVGAAGRTLKVFAQQADAEIVFSLESIGETRTKAVRGQFTAREALDQMVAETGLTVGVEEKTGCFRCERKNPAQTGPGRCRWQQAPTARIKG